MKWILLTLAASFVAFCCSCSSSKPVNILASAWNMGQHQDCIYRGGTLYCLPPSLDELGNLYFKEVDPTGKYLIPRKDTLFKFGVKIVNIMEEHRRAAESDPKAETGTYETRFSASSADYSLWDCYKTGIAHPGIQCELQRKPNAKDVAMISKYEKAVGLNLTLKWTTPVGLKKACGEPLSTSQTDIRLSLSYPGRDGSPISWNFDTASKDATLLNGVEWNTISQTIGPSSKDSWWKYSPGDNVEAAARIIEQQPCALQIEMR
jgi:hypothetical protein